MSRRGRQSSGSQVSLFPFLSILACLIGTLTLMITGLALTGMGVGRDSESIIRAEEYVALDKRKKTLQDEINKLLKMKQAAVRVSEKVAALEALLKSQDAAVDLEPKVVRLKALKKNAEKSSSELQKELAQLKKKLDSLRTEAGRKTAAFFKRNSSGCFLPKAIIRPASNPGLSRPARAV